MELSTELLRIIVCPVTGDKLLYDRENQELISLMAALAFPIRNNIPMLLIDHARKIIPQNYKDLAQSGKLKKLNDLGQKNAFDRA